MKNRGLKDFYCLLVPALFLSFNITSAQLAANNSVHRTIAQKSSPDLEVVRKRIVEDLLEGPVNTADIRQLIQSIQPDGSWPGINIRIRAAQDFNIVSTCKICLH